MPLYHYEPDPTTRKKVRLYSRCAVCGGKLWEFADDQGQAYLACKDNHIHGDKSHTGIGTEPRDPNDMTIWRKRRKEMSEQNTALAQYNQPGVAVTREIATKIVETLWKGAPPVEKAKAITICSMYNLNPCMNHIFLMKFNTKEGDKWATAIGIEATRLMAHRKHRFTYLDLTPRRATKEELDKILGADQVDPQAVYFITKIKDLKDGAEGYGLGSWKGSVYGADKGNSPANMAAIRSERQALKRLYPAEMPTGVEVADERFVEAASNGSIEGDYRVMDETTGEITEGIAMEQEEAATKAPTDKDTLVSLEQISNLKNKMNAKGISAKDLTEAAKGLDFTISKWSGLTVEQYEKLLEFIGP